MEEKDIREVRMMRTAYEVAEAYGSLKSRVIAITGCSSGLGLQTALAVSRAGATVVMFCRKGAKATKAKARIEEEGGKVHMIACDLGNIESVKSAAKAFDDLHLPLHSLVNNAGINGVPTWGKFSPGMETHFAVNYLAHCALVVLLHKHLSATKGARVVNLASESHRRVSKFDVDTMIPPREKNYDEIHAYAFSNFCRILWTRKLASKVDYPVVCIHPAVVAQGSSMLQHTNLLGLLRQSLTVLWWEWRPWNRMQSPQEGARTQTWCATAPLREIARVNGAYLNGNANATLYQSEAPSKLAAGEENDDDLFKWTMEHLASQGINW